LRGPGAVFQKSPWSPKAQLLEKTSILRYHKILNMNENIIQKGVNKMKGKRAQKYSLYAAIIIGIAIILSFSSCKNFGIPEFELKITIEEGVEGTPEAGVYARKDLSVIDYKYIAINPGHTVEVIVNGSRWVSEGQFTMYSDLDVVARIIDIRGTWNFELKYKDPDTGEEQDPIEFNITFSGNNFLSGIFTDDRGYSGTWDVVGITVTIIFNNWQDYELTGSISTMDGTWEGGGKSGGTWRAVREDS
jgi:hypothetical protein